MIALKRPLFIVAGIVFIALVSSCGSSSSSNSSSSSVASTPTSASQTYASPTTASTASTSTGTDTIKTSTITIGGKSKTILTNAAGLTLYYFTPDTSTKSACTGACATTWPPLLFNGTGSPTASTKLPSELTVYTNANGKQVEYNTHPLYTYKGDTAPGQTNGDGVGGKWFIATSDLAAQNSASSAY